MKKILWACGVALAAVSAATPASAALLNFSLTGASNATFQLDSNPTPSSFTSSFVGDQIFFNNVAGTFNGTPGVASSISFGTNLIASLNINGTSLTTTQFSGPALFSGAPSAPVFATGSFSLPNFLAGPSTLVISRANVAAAVPESSTWAMLLIGFGAIGGSMRYRRRTTAVAVA